MTSPVRFDATVSDRYRLLVMEVLGRLPEGWVGGRVVSVSTADDPTPRGFAYTTKMTGALFPACQVTLFPARMGALSDAACLWVIAHEFAHVTSPVPPQAMIGGRLCPYRGHGRWRLSPLRPEELQGKEEDLADAQACHWGFREEADVFGQEQAEILSSPPARRSWRGR
jgi:hypothetical protein